MLSLIFLMPSQWNHIIFDYANHGNLQSLELTNGTYLVGRMAAGVAESGYHTEMSFQKV
jgi:hypothetical protein